MNEISLSTYDVVNVIWSKTKQHFIDSYHQHCSRHITITTKSGLVKGFKSGSPFNYDYYNFIGIPYAKPPIGELRFKVSLILIYFPGGNSRQNKCHKLQDPEPIVPSNKIINKEFCYSGTEACQTDLVIHKPMGKENCHHLSVYTRDVNPDVLKPVMVWIHGGAFVTGSNSKDLYNPEYLLRNDIVLSAINYRLGAFGYHLT